MTLKQHKFSQLLLSPSFVACVAVLLINDICLKYLYPGLITGKLSDVTGLYVAGCMVVTVLPKKRVMSLVLLAAAFVWWKSPASGSMIAALHAQGAHIGRVVDFSDLWALLVLPACLMPSSRTIAWSAPTRRLAQVLSIALVATALMGTSALPVHDEYTIRKNEADEQIDRPLVEQTIVSVLQSNGYRICEECPSFADGAMFDKGTIVVRYQFLQSGEGVKFVVTGSPGSLFFGLGDTEDDIRDIQQKLRAGLSERVPNLEFIVDLS